MSQYEPWYLRRQCPIFCHICIPVYTGVWPARKVVLIIGAILFAIGIMILLGLLLTCIAVECSTIASALVPLALILIIVGILLFHCGWAAHLLDGDGAIEIPASTTIYKDDEKLPNENELAVFESAYREPLPEIRHGYWQFEDKEAWQTVANPYPIQ
ncbi:unnamed protein product [Dracunculus medinensis]|uniref:Uncharacterized protein n=1 Tax=Dracunculus medinensis TaxID=318479 RepID=A0A0N4U0N8_DRAME|nr:unnamed protein product [Dracunculus medinensis]